MTLRKKTILAISVIVFILMGVFYGLARLIVLNSFHNLEVQEMRQHVQRVADALLQEIEEVDNATVDWSAWDDTYTFITKWNISRSLIKEFPYDNRSNSPSPGEYFNCG